MRGNPRTCTARRGNSERLPGDTDGIRKCSPNAIAAKRVTAWQLAEAMKQAGIGAHAYQPRGDAPGAGRERLDADAGTP
ncbi:hypothetical protein CQ393_11820 [Stenotrophomonas sp. MYb238]|uniref:hypothetical protein n=1 Tax=Stenotrophomonas sp. MYb238 TaxID=2040281 RepID=UPI00129125C7|nr:hypothetical protein [Stenotrophomonas sp. MYb238]MQP76577.1 hypothetical protein [Stenotrophomonas sp. MYb238]